ncbi:MAG: transcriptional regulator [Rhizobiaceae bacterium]|nr:transcriptional regulator [Rhizobiaceae bacterium]
MQTHTAKRIEIVIEKPLEGRLTDALTKAGVTGYTVVPVRGGSGRSGPWTREGQVGRAGMVMVICLIKPERLDALLEAAFAVVERHIGIVSISDALVLRADRF